MASSLFRALHQAQPFESPEHEVLVGLQVAASRVMESLTQYLKAEAGLTPNQYNVLRILRGVHPEALTCGEIADRMMSRDPDVTRLIDRLVKRDLADRARDTGDRRVVRVTITEDGRSLLASLDPAVRDMPKVALGHLSRAQLDQFRRLLSVTIEPFVLKP